MLDENSEKKCAYVYKEKIDMYTYTTKDLRHELYVFLYFRRAMLMLL